MNQQFNTNDIRKKDESDNAALTAAGAPNASK